VLMLHFTLHLASLSFLLLGTGGLVLATDISNEDNGGIDADALDIASWITSLGGYVNPHQEIRNAEPTNPESIRGVFATAPIQSGEVLLKVPWEAIITADAEMGDNLNQCGTAYAVARELALAESGSSSRFGPYTAMLLAKQDRTGIPNTFAPLSLELLSEVLGPNGLQPTDCRRPLRWWEDSCGGNVYSDRLSASAFLLMITRASSMISPITGSETSVLVPFYDLYNHRLGSWKNAQVVGNMPPFYAVQAVRDIAPGEQIHNEYRSKNDAYTADIFRDYGFVQQTPQLWKIPVPNLRVDLVFRLDYKDGREGGGLVVEFVHVPDDIERVSSFLESELVRLDSLLPRLESWESEGRPEVPGIPSEEATKIWEYYHALFTAIGEAAGALWYRAAMSESSDDEL